MRSARSFGGMALVLALGWTVRADTVPPVLYTAKVLPPGAEVRSGQSAKMVMTNRLAPGATVEVVKELPDGWLAIKPPYNSFSWINNRFVQKSPSSPNTWVVLAHDDAPVPVLYGSDVVNDKPSVRSVDIKRGSQVVVIGPGQPSDEGMLLPIDPPPSEVRYILASAVLKNTNPAPTAGAPLPALPGRPAVAAGPHPKWLAAQAAEQTGDRQRAEQLYLDLYREVVNTDHDLGMQALNKYYYLHGSAAAGSPPVYGGYAAPVDNRVAPVPAYPSNPGTVTLRPPQPAQTSSYSQAALQSSGPGRLRYAGSCIDGCRAYALENSQGQLLTYVTAQPGINLEPYIDRIVELYGIIMYRGDLRANYMKAQQVTPR